MDARDFNKIERRAVIKFLSRQGKAPEEIQAILTETLACFLPARAKDLSAPMYLQTMKAPGSSKTAGVTCTMTQHHISCQLNPHQRSSQKLISHTFLKNIHYDRFINNDCTRILAFVLRRVHKIGKIDYKLPVCLSVRPRETRLPMDRHL